MNESTSRLVTTHRARAPSSRPLSPFHRARRASRDRIDDRGTESTTEGLNRRLRARITRNAMISTRNPSTVPPHTFASLETFVRSRHHRVRRGRRGPSSRSPARVVIHFIRTACTRARRSTWGGIHDESRPINTTFRVFFLPKRSKKKKVQHPRSKRTGYTRVMTHHRERDTYKKSHARGPMQSRSRGKKKQKHKTPTAGGEVCVWTR